MPVAAKQHLAVARYISPRLTRPKDSIRTVVNLWTLGEPYVEATNAEPVGKKRRQCDAAMSSLDSMSAVTEKNTENEASLGGFLRPKD